jgi:hypothetical protein
MATVEFRYDPKNTAWFTANAAMVLKVGEPAYHDTTGLFKLGNGVTALSALPFLPVASPSYVIIDCTGAISTAQFTSGATLYWGVFTLPASSLRTIVGQSLTSIPYNATLVGASITTWNASSGTTQNNSTLNFRLNGVDHVISSTVLWNATANITNVNTVSGLNIAVTASVPWELKLVMGTLATAPTNAAQCNVVLYFTI